MIANNFAANHIQGMVDAQAEFDQVLGNMSAVQLSYFLQPVTTRFNAFLAQANWMSTIQTRHSGERYLNCLLDHCLLKSFGWEVLPILHSDFQLCVDRILERKLYGDRNINRYMHVQLLFSILICRYSLKYAKERSLIEGFSHQKPAWEQEHLEVILWRQSRFRCFVEFVWSWAGRSHWCSSSECLVQTTSLETMQICLWAECDYGRESSRQWERRSMLSEWREEEELSWTRKISLCSGNVPWLQRWLSTAQSMFSTCQDTTENSPLAWLQELTGPKVKRICEARVQLAKSSLFNPGDRENARVDFWSWRGRGCFSKTDDVLNGWPSPDAKLCFELNCSQCTFADQSSSSGHCHNTGNGSWASVNLILLSILLHLIKEMKVIMLGKGKCWKCTQLPHSEVSTQNLPWREDL
jgi:hypothetical protein